MTLPLVHLADFGDLIEAYDRPAGDPAAVLLASARKARGAPWAVEGNGRRETCPSKDAARRTLRAVAGQVAAHGTAATAPRPAPADVELFDPTPYRRELPQRRAMREPA